MKTLAEFYDRYFAGSCLLVVRLDGAPGNSPDWITVATATLMATFFEILAIASVTLALKLETNSATYKVVTPVFVGLLAANWLFGTNREEYRRYWRAPTKDRKKVLILAASINATAFLSLAVVGTIRLV